VSRLVIATIIRPPGISKTRDAMDSSSLSLTIVFMIPIMANWLVANVFLPLLCHTLLWSSFGIAMKTMVMVGLTSPSFFFSSSLSFFFLPFFYFLSKLPGCSSHNSRRDATRSLK